MIRLVYVEHVDLVVPRPGVDDGRIGIKLDKAGSISAKHTHQGRVSRAAAHPDDKRGICGIFSRLKEPEELIDRVCLILLYF